MKYLLPLFCLLIAFSCETDPNDTGGEIPMPTTFDRQAMLTDWVDGIIVPGYETFAHRTEAMRSAAVALQANPSEANYEELVTTWKTAYLNWQQVSMFEIGKAEELGFRNQMNIYPADSQSINENVISGEYNLELPSTLDEQGFPAMDYLLYGINEDRTTIAAFYASDEASAHRDYLVALTSRMDEMTDAILDDWIQNFRVTFIENDGNSATGSVDKLVNDFIFYYEKSLRAGKIGIPAGVFSGDPLSDRVEALYADNFSKELFIAALNATQNFFNGEFENVSLRGESLKSYLDALEVEKNDQNLSDVINNQFSAARDEANKLDASFRYQVETDNIGMLTVYDALQLNVINMKVDMLQALNINIDYVDADGD